MAKLKLENQLTDHLREPTRHGRKRWVRTWLCPFTWGMMRPDVKSRVVIILMRAADIH